MRGRRQGGRDGRDSRIEAESPHKSQHVQGKLHTNLQSQDLKESTPTKDRTSTQFNPSSVRWSSYETAVDSMLNGDA